MAKDEAMFVIFGVGGEFFALPIEHIKEVLVRPTVTPVPDPVGAQSGLINLRGRILLCHDLGKILDAKEGARDSMLVGIDGKELCGIQVDSVSEVFSCDPEEIDAAPEDTARKVSLGGTLNWNDKLVFILDFESLMERMGSV